MNAESIDLDALDDIPQGTAGTGIGQNMSSAPRKLSYIKKKKAGSMEELDINMEDEPVTNQTGTTPVINTSYPAPLYQVPTKKKVEYISKKKAGSMDELDIDLDDEPVVQSSDQPVEAMDVSNCQDPTPVMETSNSGPAPTVIAYSPTAPYIEKLNGDLAPQPPVSPRSKMPRYNCEHWSKPDIIPNIDPAPLEDDLLAQPVSDSQSCSSQGKQELHKGHPKLEDDDSFQVEAC